MLRRLDNSKDASSTLQSHSSPSSHFSVVFHKEATSAIPPIESEVSFNAVSGTPVP